MKVSSREYKAMLDHTRFGDRSVAVKQYWEEAAEIMKRADNVKAMGDFDRKEKRTIAFLDTPDLSISRNGFVLRRRAQSDSVQYTLKCRSDDRYFAAGIVLRAADGLDSKGKLEEDIAPPFQCRFSNSATLTLAEAQDELPTTLAAAAALFPALAALRVDGRACPGDTPLSEVHKIEAFERVYAGPRLLFDLPGSANASVALILWSNGENGRALAAEISFRMKDPDEQFGRELARGARMAFGLLQGMDWCRPDSPTKTQFVYGGAVGE
ncbi:MAG TPA: hypothetical protein VJZ71_20045 [Phycisphaerae bacterium]|nr:hypothetical protein [Phycisphaerae bacterium]